MTEQRNHASATGGDSVRRILWLKSAHVLGLALDAEAEEESFREFQQRYGNSKLAHILWELEREYGWAFPTVIEAYPGSGKSRDASELVNVAWKTGGKRGLYLMLSHDAMIERLDRMKQGGVDLEDWQHWKGHEDGCQKRTLSSRGYDDDRVKYTCAHEDCACGAQHGLFNADRPTIAPIEYALPMLPYLGRPMRPEAERFDFWIVDEIDLRRLLDWVCVPQDDVLVTARKHPDKSVRELADVLHTLMEYLAKRQDDSPIEGGLLYHLMDGLLHHSGHSLDSLAARLGRAKFPKRPWTNGDRLPVNFAPKLLPVLLDELNMWQEGRRLFNPRIHLVKVGDGSIELHIWWRKGFSGEFGYQNEPQGYWPPSMFILDATANAELLERVFPEAESVGVQLDRPPWPDNVHVHQWADNLVTRSALGISSGRGAQDRERWYGRIGDALSDFDRSVPVGIITHKAIEDEARGALRAQGFSNVSSLHYGAERGSNELEDVYVLVLLGLPIPNPQEFKEEAQAFLYHDAPLVFNWQKNEQYLDMRDGSRARVEVSGHWDEPVAAYYRQKCQSGLYQALHRIRPYIPKDYERHIFIFTNMPVPDVKVDHLMHSEEKGRMEARFARAVDIIVESVAENGECLVPQLARQIALEGEDARTVTRWVNANGDALAEATRTRFNRGRGRRPGRFASEA